MCFPIDRLVYVLFKISNRGISKVSIKKCKSTHLRFEIQYVVSEDILITEVSFFLCSASRSSSQACVRCVQAC